MEIKVERINNTKRIKIIGDVVHSEAKNFQNAFQDMEGVTEIHFDLSEISYANSSFLTMIMGFNREYPDKKISIVNPNDFLLELLSITGFRHFFDIVTEK